MPDSLPRAFAPDVATARQIVAGVVQDGRTWLDPTRGQRPPARPIDIPVTPVTLAKTPDEAAAAAQPIFAEGGTAAVKILSPDIVHKSDVGGVKLDLTSEAGGAHGGRGHLRAHPSVQARRPHHWRHGAADGAPAQGARADRRLSR